MIYLGIDPGLTGAMAAVCTRRGFLGVYDIPTCSNGQVGGSMRRWVDVGELVTWFRSWRLAVDAADEGGVVACMERPIPMPSLPAQTIASQFDTVGALRGFLGARGDEVVMVEPARWKRAYGLGKDKAASRETAARLYPAAGKHLARARDHNRAEALLLADWLRQERDGSREAGRAEAAVEWAGAA